MRWLTLLLFWIGTLAGSAPGVEFSLEVGNRCAEPIAIRLTQPDSEDSQPKKKTVAVGEMHTFRMQAECDTESSRAFEIWRVSGDRLIASGQVRLETRSETDGAEGDGCAAALRFSANRDESPNDGIIVQDSRVGTTKGVLEVMASGLAGGSRK